MDVQVALHTKDYSIAWIAALFIERAAAIALLDERHVQPVDFVQHHADKNAYVWGRMSNHNIVIASLSAGVYGLTSATTTALGLLSSLSHIKIGLLVGIGAGIPESSENIQLGDVAVSIPEGKHGGVVQYDMGKAKGGDAWECTGILVPPPLILLNAVASLRAEHELHNSKIPTILEEARQHNEKFAENYCYPIVSTSTTGLRQSTTIPKIHYGTIASGNTLVKDAATRREIFAIAGSSCICLEMEAAGLMINFPCLVIRGICDYADARKNDVWQRYASATAAAYAKEALLHVPTLGVINSKSIEDDIGQIYSVRQRVNWNLEATEEKVYDEKVSQFMEALYTCPYAERKNRNRRRAKGTCKWFISHSSYFQWLDSSVSSVLWVSADPGCGKSVLARYLIDEHLRAKDRTICYFFFKDDFEDQKTASHAACALLRQLLEQRRQAIRGSILKRYRNAGSRYVKSFEDIWSTFVEAASMEETGEIFIVLDALDECQSTDREQLVDAILELPDLDQVNIKVLITSRPYSAIKKVFYGNPLAFKVIHLSGETDAERDVITQEIDIVIEQRVNELSVVRELTEDEGRFLLAKLTSTPQRTYLWVHLTMAYLEKMTGFTRQQVHNICDNLPATVDEAYNKILRRSTNEEKAKLLLQFIVAAERPLSVAELSILVVLEPWLDEQTLDDRIEPPQRFRTTLRDLCGLFVVIIDSRVYLLHQTAREFLTSGMIEDAAGQSTRVLKWKHSLDLGDAHGLLAERCIWVLLYFHNSYWELTNYAGSWWSQHMKNSNLNHSNATYDMALLLCRTDSSVFKLWFHVAEEPYRSMPGLFYLNLRKAEVCMMVLPACLGLTGLLRYLMDSSSYSAAQTLDIKTQSLSLAALSNHRSAVWLLANRGADCNGIEPIKSSFNLRSSAILPRGGAPDLNRPLHHVVRRGDEALTSLLITKGADVLARGVDGLSILHEAVCSTNPAVVDLLLRHGADVTQSIEYEYSSSIESYIELFCSMPHKETDCEFMLRLLRNPSDWNYYMPEALKIAAEQNRSCCVANLIEMGVIINARTGRLERSALFTAAQHGSLIVLKQLLSAGADVYCPDLFGTTSLMIACQNRSTNGSLVVSELLQHYADIRAVTIEGETCLHFTRNESVLTALLNAGGDINCLDDRRRTPLMYVRASFSKGRDGVYRGTDEDESLYAKMILLGASDSMEDVYGRTARDRRVDWLKHPVEIEAGSQILRRYLHAEKAVLEEVLP